MSDRLFDLDEIPEVPLFRPPRRSRGEHDARFRNDYPPSWHRCEGCNGTGKTWGEIKPGSEVIRAGETVLLDYTGGGIRVREIPCPDCLGMGSLKARVRLEAGHRCVRCQHPYIPKGDAKMLSAEPSWRDGGWSACDERCTHASPWRWFAEPNDRFPVEERSPRVTPLVAILSQYPRARVEAEWRILTVHHLDGDKANVAWWNLAALCQRCHLEIQAKVVMERIYPHEHSDWFKPYAAGYYASVYLGEQLEREEVTGRLDELLALERQAA